MGNPGKFRSVSRSWGPSLPSALGDLRSAPLLALTGATVAFRQTHTG